MGMQVNLQPFHLIAKKHAVADVNDSLHLGRAGAHCHSITFSTTTTAAQTAPQTVDYASHSASTNVVVP